MFCDLLSVRIVLLKPAPLKIGSAIKYTSMLCYLASHPIFSSSSITFSKTISYSLFSKFNSDETRLYAASVC